MRPTESNGRLSPIVATSTLKCLIKLIKRLVTNIENQGTAFAPPHPAYDGARISFRSRAGVDQCLPLPTHRCLLLPTFRRKWFSSFLVSEKTNRYSGKGDRICTYNCHACRFTIASCMEECTFLRQKPEPSIFGSPSYYPYMVELTSSAPRVQPIIHIKKYLHDS